MTIDDRRIIVTGAVIDVDGDYTLGAADVVV